MRSGFVKVSVAVPVITTGDCEGNANAVIKLINEASGKKADVVVFPELCITGSACGSLFRQNVFTSSALYQIIRVSYSVPSDITVVCGAPFLYGGRLYDCAFFCNGGHIVGIVPKKYASGFFSPGPEENIIVEVDGRKVPFGCTSVFYTDSVPGLCIGCTFGSDIKAPCSPASVLCSRGVTLLCCPDSLSSASFSDEKRDSLVSSESLRLSCCLAYVCSGEGESTTDGVFTGRCIVAECGDVLLQTESEENHVLETDTDINFIVGERLETPQFCSDVPDFKYSVRLGFSCEDVALSRKYSSSPFIPENTDREKWCSRIFNRQVLSLGARFSYVRARTLVVGLSGGLDSTLALLVAVSACERMSVSTKRISCITMPCFGTTSRTKNNACVLAESLGCSLRTINIADSVTRHFADIGHRPDVYDAAFENSQARERTQILMDIANQENGIVVGTGDLSELALGWATYNGDHMSMYGVNAGVPKTLVRALVDYYAGICTNSVVRDTLKSILDTPISPELIPGQETEELVGPYELHDFFIYHMLRRRSSPAVIYRIACRTFEDVYEKAVIEKWLGVFCRRFFSQQFKRSCMPDGPAVLDISLSPRNGFSMPSDASNSVWLDNLRTTGRSEEAL